MQINVRIIPSGEMLTGQPGKVIQRNLDAMITEATLFLLKEVKKRTPVGVYGDKGGLRGSIQADFQGRGTPAVKGIVATASKYGLAIEKGRTAGKAMPPKGSLVRWLEVRLGLDEKTAQRIEYVVRRKIGAQGFKKPHEKGYRMFERAIALNWAQLERIFVKGGFSLTRELSE